MRHLHLFKGLKTIKLFQLNLGALKIKFSIFNQRKNCIIQYFWKKKRSMQYLGRKPHFEQYFFSLHFTKNFKERELVLWIERC